jgi:hypothetical protein
MKSVYGESSYADITAELKQQLTRLRRELKVPEVIPTSWYGNPPGTGKGAKQKAKAAAAEKKP